MDGACPKRSKRNKDAGPAISSLYRPLGKYVTCKSKPGEGVWTAESHMMQLSLKGFFLLFIPITLNWDTQVYFWIYTHPWKQFLRFPGLSRWLPAELTCHVQEASRWWRGNELEMIPNLFYERTLTSIFVWTKPPASLVTQGLKKTMFTDGVIVYIYPLVPLTIQQACRFFPLKLEPWVQR